MKNKTKLLAAILCLAMVIALTPANDSVYAADVVQTNATTTAISFKWTAPSRSGITITGYLIGYGKTSTVADTNAKNGQVKVSASSSMYTLKSLTAGRKYYVTVYYQYYYNNSPSTTYKGYIGTTAVRTTPITVSGLANTGDYRTTSSTLYFDWTPQGNASGYNYVVYSLAGKQLLTKNVSGSSGSYTDAANKGLAYKVRLRAYLTVNSKNLYGPWSSFVYMIPQPVSGEAKVTDAKILYLKWGKVTGATSYEIFVSTTGRRSGYKKVATITNANTYSTAISSFNGSRFDKERTYFVYIRAVKTIGGKTYYSDTSSREMVITY